MLTAIKRLRNMKSIVERKKNVFKRKGEADEDWESIRNK
jgi:hypothetical protein